MEIGVMCQGIAHSFGQLLCVAALLCLLSSCSDLLRWDELYSWGSGVGLRHEVVAGENYLLLRRFVGDDHSYSATGSVEVLCEDGAVTLFVRCTQEHFGFAKAGACLIQDRDSDNLPELVVASFDRRDPRDPRMIIEAIGSRDRARMWSTDGKCISGSGHGLEDSIRGTGDRDGDGVRDLVVVWCRNGPRIPGGIQVLSGATGTVLQSVELKGVRGQLGSEVHEFRDGFVFGMAGPWSIGHCEADGLVKLFWPGRIRAASSLGESIVPVSWEDDWGYAACSVPWNETLESRAWLIGGDPLEPLYEFSYTAGFAVGRDVVPVPDLDHDGLPELVLSAFDAVYLQQSRGAFNMLLSCLPLDLEEAWDLDGNGISEIAVLVDRDWDLSNNLEPGQ